MTNASIAILTSGQNFVERPHGREVGGVDFSSGKFSVAFDCVRSL